MAKQLFRFGDQETADIKLQVISDDGGEESNVYVHSQVLKKSEFYEAWLSRRWSLDEPLRELKIRVSASSEIYLKCFHLIYSCEADERFCFSSVDEALDILSVVSQMLFLEAIKQFMEYLDAVRWSSEQEAKIRDMLSSLQIKILPELATRIGMDLNKSDRGHLDMVKEILQDMLSTSGSNNGLPRTGVEQYIVGYFEAANRASAKAVADTCRSLLFDEFCAIVERIRFNEFSQLGDPADRAWATLLWLFDVVRRCDGRLYQTLIKKFCEDGYFRDSVKYSRFGVKNKLGILVHQILNPMGNGEITTPASFRVSFLTTWLYPMLLLIENYPKRDEKLSVMETMDRGIMNVADTLPLLDQKLIYNIWKDLLKGLAMNQSNALNWWAQKVQDAIQNGKII